MSRLPHLIKKLTLVTFLFALAANLVAGPVYATECAQGLSKVDCDALNYGWTDWVPDACAGLTASGGTLSGSDNEQKAFNYFISKGLTPIATAAILGNFMHESGMDPAIEQAFGSWQDTSPPGDYNHAVGIAQWDGPRRLAIIKAAITVDKAKDLGFQLDYSWAELNSNFKNALDATTSAADITTATEQFERLYEISADKPGSAPWQDRINKAKDALQKYGNTTSGGTNEGATSANCIAGGGSVSVSGVVFISQRDKRWDGHDVCWYEKSLGRTLCDSVHNNGCWAASNAMIISTFTGQYVTPMQLEAPASDPASKPHVDFDTAKLHSRDVGNNIDAALSAVKDNTPTNIKALVLVHAHKVSNDPFYGTTSHWEVIRGVDSSGGVLVNDPWDLPDDSNPLQPLNKYGNVKYDGYWQFNSAHSTRAWPISDFKTSGLEFTIVTK